MNRSLLPPALLNPLTALQPAVRASAGADADEGRSFDFTRALSEARQAARPQGPEPNGAAAMPPVAPEPPARAPERTADADRPRRTQPPAHARAEDRQDRPGPDACDEAPRSRVTEAAARRAQPPAGASGAGGPGGARGAPRPVDGSARPGARKVAVPDADANEAPSGPRGPRRAEPGPDGNAAIPATGPESGVGLPTIGAAEAPLAGLATGTATTTAGGRGHAVAAAHSDLVPGARTVSGVGTSGAASAAPDATRSLVELPARQARWTTPPSSDADGARSAQGNVGDAIAALADATGAAADTGVAALAATTAPTAQGPLAGTFSVAASASAAANPVLREATLSSGPGQEGFARELGAQVSVFVREGVQQARLQLNPQDMGPVLVHIRLEGQTAQVHMAAEALPTRQALEQALPTLASQLSDAGITLTGGGVSARPDGGFETRGGTPRDAHTPRGPDLGEADPGAPRNGVAATAETGRWSRARGLVDLVA